jgi:hypothetical protein
VTTGIAFRAEARRGIVVVMRTVVSIDLACEDTLKQL